jgi:hypothetical protein
MFLTQNTSSTIPPFNDSQRVYSDHHQPNIYGCTNDAHTRSFEILDLPQRRWYEVNIPQSWYEVNIPHASSTWPPPPLSEAEQDAVEALVAQHIARQRKPFNTINIDRNGNATYEVKQSIGVPLRRQPIVSGCSFPTANYDDITKKKYVDRAVDTCVWKGTTCIYKQLEFDGLIAQMQREISLRETILHHFDGTNPALLSTLGVSPILAVVVHGNPPLLCGILLSHVGVTFENAPEGQITGQHLVSLLRTVEYLRSAQVVHGDICARNVCIDGSSTQLIDFGEIAPGYKNDVVASGELLLWCVERMMATNEVKEKISRAANKLIDLEDLNTALVILENSSGTLLS